MNMNVLKWRLHTQCSCDAKAWGATETLRVWKLLNSPNTQAK